LLHKFLFSDGCHRLQIQTTTKEYIAMCLDEDGNGMKLSQTSVESKWMEWHDVVCGMYPVGDVWSESSVADL